MFTLAQNAPMLQERLRRVAAGAGFLPNIKEVALHIGSLHESGGHQALEFKRALECGNVAWTDWHDFWFCERASLEWRSCIFRDVVQGCMLDGLEAVASMNASPLSSQMISVPRHDVCSAATAADIPIFGCAKIPYLHIAVGSAL